MADVANVKVGVCSVTFNGVDLGHTKGGVEVSYEPEYFDVTVDKYGNTVIDKKLVGEKLTAKVPLAEYTIANLNIAIPTSTLAGSGSARATIGKSAGASLKDEAAVLVLHPISEGSSRAFDVVLYKAVVAGQITLAHKVDEQRVVECMFEGLLDESKTDGAYLGLIGDSAA